MRLLKKFKWLQPKLKNAGVMSGILIVAIFTTSVTAQSSQQGFWFEAESGTLSNATLAADTSASGNNAVRFGAGEPAAALKGWQLTPTNTGLAPHGLSCDSLAAYAGSSKPAAGTVITEKRISSSMDLSNGNITIERSCIRPTGGGANALLTTTDFNQCCSPTTGVVTIRDSEINGSLLTAQTAAFQCAFGGVGILERNYIHGMGSGICFFNTGNTLDARAEGNYVHQLRAWGNASGTGSHNEAFTIRDFPTNSNPNRRLAVRNNRLDSSSGNDTGAFFIQTYAGDIDQVLVEGNLLEGGGYQLILEAGFGNIYGTNLAAINNRFSGTGWGPGYSDGKELNYSWSQWSENYRNDPSKPDNKGQAVPKL